MFKIISSVVFCLFSISAFSIPPGSSDPGLCVSNVELVNTQLLAQVTPIPGNDSYNSSIEPRTILLIGSSDETQQQLLQVPQGSIVCMSGVAISKFEEEGQGAEKKIKFFLNGEQTLVVPATIREVIVVDSVKESISKIREASNREV